MFCATLVQFETREASCFREVAVYTVTIFDRFHSTTEEGPYEVKMSYISWQLHDVIHIQEYFPCSMCVEFGE